MAHGEALDLKNEHARLTNVIVDAKQSLADFERDKLGMKDDKDVSEVAETQE